MNRLTIVAAFFFAGTSALVLGHAPNASASPSEAPPVAAAHAHGGILVRTSKQVILPRHGGTASSQNWSGYAVTAPRITAVASTFTVPTAGLVPSGFAATWAGIGGYGTSDLIQAGTAEESLPSSPLLGSQYYAWYELLPATETRLTGCSDINCTVTPGDVISVHINQVGPANTSNNWSIEVSDAGHWTWSIIVTYTSSNSSAEWILEAPSISGTQTVLAPVGKVAFGPTSTFSTGGNPIAVAQGNPTQIDMVVGATVQATPSSLAADGQSFNVCAYSSSCSAPGASPAQGLPPSSPPGSAQPSNKCMWQLPAGTGVGLAVTSDDHGYWIATSAGRVDACGDAAANYGDLTSPPPMPIVGITATPDGGGYYLVADDGGIFAFGDAPFYGSMGGSKLNQPIVGMAVDAVTGGYWLVASDGGIFSFNAPFYGSTGNMVLNQPIVGMAADPVTGGYWLVASDGGIFAANAPFYGSMGGVKLNQPVVGMAVNSVTGGYWLVASDGGIFSFNAPFYGSTGNIVLNRPIVGMEASPDATGYRFVASDGGIFASGDSKFYGSGA